ncbi:AMP-binding enzyme, C-terminal domain [Dillenia turbinata]|uniref:AMP-binding enzyme, C-terminal domain n=1 Tax=Dillenia turbinata TaxID=194707 RepID=A0AAN8YUJ1_9MAGN
MNLKSDSIDTKSGYCSETASFRSLRPQINFPPENIPLSVASYALILRSSNRDSTVLIDSATGDRVTYSEFTHRVNCLASNLHHLIGLKKGDIAFILSPNSLRVPILYFSLLSLGVIVSPANPSSTPSEIFRLIQLSKPVTAFITNATAQNIPSLPREPIVIDSPEFESLMTRQIRELEQVQVSQNDLAAVMYSSGTTGEVKAVMLTHRNFIAILGSYQWEEGERAVGKKVVLYTVPYFHIYGFIVCLKSMAFNEAVVLMERFDVRRMLEAVERFQVTHLGVAPPVVVALVKCGVTEEFDLRSLVVVGCGGAPLGKDVIEAFATRFPTVQLMQGYGLTESTGGCFRTSSPEEALRRGSAGRLLGSCEAKIVDPESSIGLPPCKQGELWIRGPIVMKGYLGDSEATSAALAPDGWLRTGDLCYIDEEGYLFVVDRLKELIKYKGYQVAPAELEQLLQSHPDIVDAAVIPYPDEEAGEIPMAFVIKHPHSNIDEVGVKQFIAKQVAPYKKIRRVSFVSSIPKTASGKILRKDLIKAALQQSSLSKL